ncbi:uncharacterized protein LOC131841584 [Achroia grisella]|uniref:uncharacterized protein LOC131841584 n=1 Tax=Achroia grisella TaxID=688607 RepID=UPI0027D24B6B|nr:uncharacterized protein LOC131841584 [Achroia grisella]
MCKLKKSVKKMHEIGVDDEKSTDSDCEPFFVSSVYNINEINSSHNWFEILPGEHGFEKFKLDTGADINVLSLKRYLSLGYDINSICTDSNIILQAYGGNSIPIRGTSILQWWYKNVLYELKFAIADIDCQSVLGYESCETLGLIKRIHSVTMSKANGKSERAVQTLKKMLTKTIDSNGDFYLNLLSYRNTPRDNNLNSPAQLLMGRRLNCRLPVHPDLLKVNNDVDHKIIVNKQKKTKLYYDQRCKQLPELNVGDDVIMIENNDRIRECTGSHYKVKGIENSTISSE